MSAPQFTPGPWFVKDNPALMIVAQEDYPVVAELCAIEASEGEAEFANARLIAAAPELYEADGEALDTFVKLRADLAEEDAERHAQRIAVIDLEIERLTAVRAKARGDDQ